MDKIVFVLFKDYYDFIFYLANIVRKSLKRWHITFWVGQSYILTLFAKKKELIYQKANKFKSSKWRFFFKLPTTELRLEKPRRGRVYSSNRFEWKQPVNFNTVILKWSSRESEHYVLVMGCETLTPKDIRLSKNEQTTNPWTTFVWEVLTVHSNELRLNGPRHFPLLLLFMSHTQKISYIFFMTGRDSNLSPPFTTIGCARG